MGAEAAVLGARVREDDLLKLTPVNAVRVLREVTRDEEALRLAEIYAQRGRYKPKGFVGWVAQERQRKGSIGHANPALAEASERLNSTPESRRRGRGFIVLLLLVAGAIYWLTRAPDTSATSMVQGAQKEVAAEFERAHGIASANGSKMDRCVQAGLAAAAHLQAGSQTDYDRWKAQQKVDCYRAGLPLEP